MREWVLYIILPGLPVTAVDMPSHSICMDHAAIIQQYVSCEAKMLCVDTTVGLEFKINKGDKDAKMGCGKSADPGNVSNGIKTGSTKSHQ